MTLGVGVQHNCSAAAKRLCSVGSVWVQPLITQSAVVGRQAFREESQLEKVWKIKNKRMVKD